MVLECCFRSAPALLMNFQKEGDLMKRFLIAICSIALAFGLAGCWAGSPVGKGKAPVVYTKG
jgi:hypothetical protein